MSIAEIIETPLMTVAQFLRWPGDGTDTRYELVNGELRAMAPGSDTHNTIVTNIAFLLERHLQEWNPTCRAVVAPGVQPQIQAGWNFRIPDIGVTCARAEKDAGMLPAPRMLVEVLSPTNWRDTRENIGVYASIPSVQDILVVASHDVKVELHARGEDGNWPPEPEVLGSSQEVWLQSIECRCPVSPFYRNTYLEDGGAGS